MKSQNITAIATPVLPSGVAVIRISGDSPLEIAKKMFKPTSKIKVEDFEPYKLYTGEVNADNFTDYGMCVYFKAPKSFTGEDVVEFHIHGGVAITTGVLNKIISLGARLARNGEFTKRAFLNGKLSLSSCEGLIDMINSQSVSGVKAGYSLYREGLTKTVSNIQQNLTDALAEINADMDFPEEDLEQLSTARVREILVNSISKIESLLNTYHTGRKLVSGVKVGIIGKPNTGKSSLLNALLNYDKAIVSNLAGTTRDVVEGSIDINGIRFNFFDTAGIREDAGDIERLGVNMSKKIILQSDLILYILDTENDFADQNQIAELIKDKNVITIVNKIDKIKVADNLADVYISALNKTNIDKLRELMLAKTCQGVDVNGEYLCEQRHFEALKDADEKLQTALSQLNVLPLELVAMDIKEGWDSLGEISGKTANEEIINNIFSKFCVGK